MEPIGSTVKKSMIWVFMERFGTKGVQFLLQLILARILVPEDYGLCALLLAFINIATVFIDSGLPSALIQKKDCNSLDFSSVFWVSLLIAVLAYIALLFGADGIASFFNNEKLAPGLRVISIMLLLGVFNSVQLAFMKKKMQFKKQFKANISGVIVSAIVSVILALRGFGVWAIIYQYIINRVVVTLVLSYYVRWFPRWEFSLECLKGLFSFGWKCMATSFLSTVVTDIYTTVVGKFFTKSQLGVYDTGNRIPATVSETFTSSLGVVLFPAFSLLQDNRGALKGYVQKSNRISTFLMFPLMFGLAAAADSLVRLVLTDKWAGAVVFLQIACFLYAFYPLHIANIQAINGLGRSDIALKNEFMKKVVDLSFLALMVHFGLIWVALGRALTSVISLWINMRPNKRMLNYSTHEQLADILPSLVIAVITAAVMYFLHVYFHFVPVLMLLVQCVAGLVVYAGLSYAFNRSTLQMVIQSILKKNGH